MRDMKARHRNQVKRHRKQGLEFRQQHGKPLEKRLHGAEKKEQVRNRLAVRSWLKHGYK